MAELDANVSIYENGAALPVMTEAILFCSRNGKYSFHVSFSFACCVLLVVYIRTLPWLLVESVFMVYMTSHCKYVLSIRLHNLLSIRLHMCTGYNDQAFAMPWLRSVADRRNVSLIDRCHNPTLQLLSYDDML
jgi:hypothetical protein